MTLKRLVVGTALFASGVMLAEPVKYAIASMKTKQELPRAEVQYRADGAYVNGNKIYANRVGEPRCDWTQLSEQERDLFAATQLQKNDHLIGNYLNSLPDSKKRQVVYVSLVQLARSFGGTVGNEVDRMKDAYGMRWELVYPNAQSDSTRR